MNQLFAIVIAAIVVTLLYFLAPILTPFLVGALLAYLVNPIVNALMRLHMPRIAAVAIVFLVILCVITLVAVLVVPLAQEQIANLMNALPDMVAWIQNTVVPSLKQYLGSQEMINVSTLKSQLTDNWTKAGGVVGWILATILHSGFALLHGLLNIILIFVVTFYLLYDWKKVVDGLRGLLPRHNEPVVVKIVQECNEVLGAFFRGQLLVMLTLGIYYSIGLSIIGLHIGLVIGIIVGLLSIIPYLGIIIGVITASIAAYVQFGTYVSIVPVLLLFAVGQTLDGMFVTPNLVGNRIGLHPVAVIFAVLAGGVLFGFFGVLLALPVAAIVMVLARFLNARYRSSHLYND